MSKKTAGGRTKGPTVSSPEALLRRLFPPMLATLASSFPSDEKNWILELKYDGFRALSAVTDGRVAVWSRNELDLGLRFPSVPKNVAAAVGQNEAVLDGEIVALDENGAPRFQLLQQGDERAVLFLFDLLWLNGSDLRLRPLEDRQEMLRKLIPKSRARVRVAEQVNAPGKLALEGAARLGFEGIIAKKRGSFYEPKRSKCWLKLKAVNAQEFAIIGYTLATNSTQQIGALHLGVMKDGEMHYAGKVGTGFSAKQRADLKRDLERDAVAKPLTKGAPRDRKTIWVKPRLVGQVRFTEWTSDGRLRHPSFLGLRPDKKPAEVVREKPSPGSSSSEAHQGKNGTGSSKKRPSKTPEKKKKGEKAAEVILTNPNRLLYPRDGITKQQVADYFDAVADAMIYTLRERPLALEHWNQGIDRPSWFQQNIGSEAEEWMTLVETPTRTSKRTVRHLVVDRRETLRWLAQHSVLTIHMWSSRASNLESPDWMVFDLDPAKGKGIEQAVEAALVLRRVFEQMELPSVPKTSGKRGIHIFVPLRSGASHEEATAVACRISETIANKVDFMTTDRPLAQRKGRLYLDCLQNGYGKTLVAPYSLRAIDGAPVSAPLKWSEINKRLDPLRFNIHTMPDRLAKFGDLFRPVIDGGVRLPRLR